MRSTLADTPVALLAGGLATRLRPITESIPKVLVEVAGRPFVDHQLALLRRRGFRQVVLCLGYLGTQVEDYLGDGSQHGLELCYSHDGERLLGTGGALCRAKELLGDVFWVMYGDSYLDCDFAGILADFQRRGAAALMTVLCNEGLWDQSNVVFRDGHLVRYSKRERLAAMSHIDAGASLLRVALLERIPEGQPHDLADLYGALVAEGAMVGHEVSKRFYEIGTPAGLAETNEFLANRGAEPRPRTPCR